MCKQGDAYIKGEVEFQSCNDLFIWRPICMMWENTRTHWYYTGDFMSHWFFYELGDIPCDDLPVRGRHTRPKWKPAPVTKRNPVFEALKEMGVVKR